MNGVNITNLKLYRDYLVEHGTPIPMDMTWFQDTSTGRGINDPRSDLREGECLTSGCLLGNAPLTGIPELAITDTDHHWSCYGKRVFGDMWAETWDFLFDGRWTNDLQAAISRMNYVIENGNHPVTWDDTWLDILEDYNWLDN